MIRSICTALFVFSAFSASAAFALTASQVVEREVKIVNADGSISIKRELADMVTPGDNVVYSLNYHNDAKNPAGNIVLVMPVPAEIKYQENSAMQNGVRTVFSADGGKHYANRGKLMVSLDDGKRRKALAEDITHIRWTIEQAVAPGTSGSLSFKGQLR